MVGKIISVTTVSQGHDKMKGGGGGERREPLCEACREVVVGL